MLQSDAISAVIVTRRVDSEFAVSTTFESEMGCRLKPYRRILYRNVDTVHSVQALKKISG